MLDNMSEALSQVDRGALMVVNHSGGKDSQAMLALVAQVVPARQIIVVHADLPGVEWEGTWQHVQEDAARHGVPAFKVTAGKTFIQMVERRGMWPSASTRQCTSDLKRDPIDKFIRAYLKAHPEFGDRVVSAMGLRAEESPARSKQVSWKYDARNSKAGREWFRWLPIQGLKVAQVWDAIRDAGGEPHWAYAQGMSRLSCCFCIMSSKSDLCTAARLNPTLYREYVALEKTLGHTMSMAGVGLETVTGIAA